MKTHDHERENALMSKFPQMYQNPRGKGFHIKEKEAQDQAVIRIIVMKSCHRKMKRAALNYI